MEAARSPKKEPAIQGPGSGSDVAATPPPPCVTLGKSFPLSGPDLASSPVTLLIPPQLPTWAFKRTK